MIPPTGTGRVSRFYLVVFLAMTLVGLVLGAFTTTNLVRELGLPRVTATLQGCAHDGTRDYYCYATWTATDGPRSGQQVTGTVQGLASGQEFHAVVPGLVVDPPGGIRAFSRSTTGELLKALPPVVYLLGGSWGLYRLLRRGRPALPRPLRWLMVRTAQLGRRSRGT